MGHMIVLLLIVFGVCLGSFVNALVWRLHEQGKLKKAKKKSGTSPDLSIVKGRSMCPHCHHALAAKDLIPVLSWLQLRGKCRYCHKPYDDTPLTELLVPLLFLLSYAYWPLTFNTRGELLFVFWLVFLVGFVALIIYDIRWQLLPNRIVYPLLGLAIIEVLLMVGLFDGRLMTLRSDVLGAAIGGGIFYLLFQVSNGRWIGGGDVKLGAVLGLIVGGPWPALLLLFLASCLGSLTAVPLLLTGKAKRSTRLAFGPFLIVAAIIVYLFGASMIAWYRRQVLLV
jgi:prepilin signal peptidase PulO-like enzyme (type II secretory pathway)